jgi:hypothetical protein
MSSLSTLVLEKTGNVARNVLIAQWNWIIGSDVNINSRIFIGDKVKRMYILLARAAVVGFLVWQANPIVQSLDDIKEHIEAIIQEKINTYTKLNRKNVVGSALLMQFNTFLKRSWNVLFSMVETTIALTSAYAKIIATLAGVSGNNVQSITGLIASSFENILVGESIMSEGGSSVALGGISYMAGLSMFNFLERSVVGIIAQSSEYIVNNKKPVLTIDNLKILMSVAKQNPRIGRVPFTTMYAFTDTQENIMDQFNKEIDSKSWKNFILGISKLGDAIQAAKEYLKPAGARELLQEGESKQREKGKQRKKGKQMGKLPMVSKGLRQRVKTPTKGKKQCAAMTKKKKQCKKNAMTGSIYCKAHQDQGQFEPDHDFYGKKVEFADKIPLMF